MTAPVSFLARSLLKLPRAIQVRSMYQHPYIKRHHEMQEVSEDYPKKSTGLTGLYVNEHPHRSLKTAYGRILRVLQKFPVDSEYRKGTEPVIVERLKIVESVRITILFAILQEPDVFKLEDKIGMGQIEEVILQAEYELQAARILLENKVWEPLVEKPSESQWRWPIS